MQFFAKHLELGSRRQLQGAMTASRLGQLPCDNVSSEANFWILGELQFLDVEVHGRNASVEEASIMEPSSLVFDDGIWMH